jgi:hypothetical protein
MLFISLLFHEIGIFLFLFYPAVFLIFRKIQKKIKLSFFINIMMFFILIFIFIRIPFFFGFITSLPELTDITPPPISVYPYRSISISLKSIASSLIPEKTLISASEELVRLSYPQFVTADNLPNPSLHRTINCI